MGVYLVFHGGRGADSGTGTSLDTGRPMKFYDETDRYRGMNVQQWEDAVKDKKTEHIALFDKDGKLMVAGTSHSKGSVAVPTHMVDMKQVDTLSHNHPYAGGRGVGGTFSEADVANHAAMGIRQSRAVSNGAQRESKYIITSRSGANSQGLQSAVSRIKSNGTMQKTGIKVSNDVSKKLAGQGRTMSSEQRSTVGLGAMKRVWKDTVDKYGYDYVELKRR